ncbi:adenylate/guanylate cyclase domain-containing protein [Flexithrix dorotheae]|uniref:adenylate/guanylate cyclase domain-containing protein n=1 Tax=Flexithrix dorotheae TaxID=70993 RepID=UPI00035EDD9F|nr:adenylate/guanylate cyclase domain-containing protein [Flexithrix dorotheae]
MKSYNTRKLIYDSLTNIIIWIIFLFYFILIRSYGVEETPAFERTMEFNIFRGIAQAITGGLIIGILFSVINLGFEFTNLRKKSYLVIILIETFCQLIITLLAILGIISVTRNYLPADEIIDIKAITAGIIFGKTFFIFFSYSLIVSLFINFFRSVKQKIGPHVFFNLLLGKYRNPIEEERIFLFVDLKSSTTIAEKLGHIKYSNLIKDCFSDLTETIFQHQIEVYQYVGDEAVLTWKMKEGLKNHNCIKAFFHYQDTLNKKSQYYTRKYGLVPVFKAGGNIGTVTTTEVGVIKREIAYHSDVLNTAARIQGKCNEYGQSLLISESLKEKLKLDNSYISNELGEVLLRGKNEVVKIFSVEQTSSTLSKA